MQGNNGASCAFAPSVIQPLSAHLHTITMSFWYAALNAFLAQTAAKEQQLPKQHLVMVGGGGGQGHC